MAGYIFTVKDRLTDEILCQGSAEKCADFISCSPCYIRGLARKNPNYKAETKYSGYKVERQIDGEIKRGGAHRKDIVCCDCGVLMVNASAHQKRCPDCAREYTNARKREHMRMLRGTGLVANTKSENTIRDWCEGCVYYRGDFETTKCCNYIFMEDKRRPCPPGKGCTVKMGRKRYREKKERSTGIS